MVNLSPLDLIERVTGPRNCQLIGLGPTWAVFKWSAGLPSCSLGNLIGYELSSSTVGSGEVVVRRYRSDSSTTVQLASELLPGTQYRAQVRHSIITKAALIPF